MFFYCLIPYEQKVASDKLCDFVHFWAKIPGKVNVFESVAHAKWLMTHSARTQFLSWKKLIKTLSQFKILRIVAQKK